MNRLAAPSRRRINRENIKCDQVEYPDEDPWIRQKFEEELARRGLTTLMPDEAYQDRDYAWDYRSSDEH